MNRKVSRYQVCRFPSHTIRHTVQWYSRFCLNDPDIEELLPERGTEEAFLNEEWEHRFLCCGVDPLLSVDEVDTCVRITGANVRRDRGMGK